VTSRAGSGECVLPRSALLLEPETRPSLSLTSHAHAMAPPPASILKGPIPQGWAPREDSRPTAEARMAQPCPCTRTSRFFPDLATVDRPTARA
jgi:hypothetical protein